MQNATVTKRVNACEISRNENGSVHIVFLNGPAWDHNPIHAFELLVMEFGCDPAKAHEAMIELGIELL